MAVTRWPLLRVVYMSGILKNLHVAGAQPGHHHGETLAKPFNPQQLASAIATALTLPLASGERMWMASLTGGVPMAIPRLQARAGPHAGAEDRVDEVMTTFLAELRTRFGAPSI